MTWPGKCAVYGRVLAAVCLCFGLMAAAVPGVSQVVQQEDKEAVPTLHVYVNTVQIPVLVLSPAQEPLRQPIQGNRFSISLDKGPWFRATHVRPEGEDAISLAILLDTSGEAAHLMPGIDEAIAGLVPGGLHAQDRVSVYGMDCGLIHIMRDTAPDGAALRNAVEQVLLPSGAGSGGKRSSGECRSKTHLRSSLMYVISDVGSKPGRKVLLAVTDGGDQGRSTANWDQVTTFAQRRSVAVFGLTWAPLIARYTSSIRTWVPERAFITMCNSTGGMLRMISTEETQTVLASFMKMLRERYIVEFPRAHNATVGEHELRIRIDKGSDLFVRSAGDSMPLPDPVELTGRNTVAGDPEKAPQEGKKP